jgi:hypothetical protein
MKTGKLIDIPGYVPVKQTARYKQEDAAYLNYKAFIPANVITMAPVAVVAFLLARRAFRSTRPVVRWLLGGGAIAGGLLGMFIVLFFWILAFYDKPGDSGPGSPWVKWVDDYNGDMAFLVAGKLLGHEPADAWQIQIDQSVHLVANREILLLTYYDTYLMVPAAEVQTVRKLTRDEIQAAIHATTLRATKRYDLINLDPNAEVMSLILNEPPYHEWGPTVVGPFEIVLKTPRPRGIWINRESSPVNSDDRKDPSNSNLLNDAFMLRLMKALHPEEGSAP